MASGWNWTGWWAAQDDPATLSASAASPDAMKLGSLSPDDLLRSFWIYVQMAAHEVWLAVRPGGRLHPAFFFEAKGHLGVELVLVVTIVFLLTRKPSKPNSGRGKPLSKQEQQELVDEWQPEPLAPPRYDDDDDDDDDVDGEEEAARLRRPVGAAGKPSQIRYRAPPVLAGNPAAPYVYLSSESAASLKVDAGSKLLNMVSTNFANLATHPRVQAACEAAIDKYGCGSCGPRGFYGTIDVHLDLERECARFLGTEESILYSYDISTPASAIPAFCKTGDLVVCDSGCSYAIQSGIQLSRSTCVLFAHNDVCDLERVLKELSHKHQAGAGTQRRFIVVEGIYGNYGDAAPLEEVVRLKNKYGFRVIVDESFAWGCVGRRGRGALERAGVDPKSVDIVLASLGHAMGSVGGICAGSSRVCDHQRLSGAGYVFSASLPPYLAAAALASLDVLREEGPERVATLARKVGFFRDKLMEDEGVYPLVLSEDLGADKAGGRSPLMHLQYASNGQNKRPGGLAYAARVRLLDAVVQEAAKEGVLLAQAKYSVLDRLAGTIPPSIKLAVNVDHADKDLARCAAIIKKLAKRLLQ